MSRTNSNLSGSGILTVVHDNTLTGDGTGGSPLSVVGSDISTSVISVRSATTAVLAGAPVYNNGVAGVGATLTRTGNGALPSQGGVSLIVGDRLLVKNQAAQLQNGVYEVTTLGSAGVPYVLTRTTDADTTDLMDELIVSPTEGTLKGTLWGQNTQSPTIGVSNIVFTQTTGLYVTQATAGTQVARQIPIWNSTARQLTKGTANFTYNPNTGVLKTDNGSFGSSVFIGNSLAPGVSTDSIIIGTNAGNAASGANNVYLGPTAGGAVSGGNNIFIGSASGNSATNAIDAVFIGRSAGNGGTFITTSVFLGSLAGNSSPTATNSIFIGFGAGDTDAVDNTLGGYSILIGPGTSTGGFSNSIAIGENATNTKANQLFIDSNVTSFSLVGMQAFADDAAAGVGGVSTGELYQTTGAGAAPLNVAGIVMIKQ